MNYWLLKTEPDSYGLSHLLKEPKKICKWDGVRNYQARNFMRDKMRKGDLAFFYHCSCKTPAIMAVLEVAKEAYPDPSAFNPESRYFDPKSTPENPRWFQVDLKLVETVEPPITLAELRDHPALTGLVLLKTGNRLSVSPVTKAQWETILAMR